jgi:putative transposase
VTTSGRLEELQVPRDREDQFHTQVLERYRRNEPQVAQGLTEMFVAGVSTHKIGEVAETPMGVAPSASAISRLNQDLEQQFTTWRQRRLQERWHILYLDVIHFSVRHGDQGDSTVILTALGVDMVGNKEVLAPRACAEEGKNGWVSVLEDLQARGATQIDLIVTDDHDGLLAALATLFPASPRQRCLLHTQGNVLNAIPRRVRREVETELAGIWTKPNKKDALTQLAAFKVKYGNLYPEAVRGLSEEEEKTLTFTSSLKRCTATPGPPTLSRVCSAMCANAPIKLTGLRAALSCLTIVWATIEGLP